MFKTDEATQEALVASIRITTVFSEKAIEGRFRVENWAVLHRGICQSRALEARPCDPDQARQGGGAPGGRVGQPLRHQFPARELCGAIEVFFRSHAAVD